MAYKHEHEADALTKLQHYYDENQKLISGAFIAILVVVAGYVGFFHWYIPGQEQEAQEKMFRAVSNFENDNYEAALNGDGSYPGVLDIAKKYKFTKAANLAHYYAGMSYLNTGQFQNAIDHLNKFSSKDKVAGTLALGAIGDAYMELGNTSEGISYYKKAANNQPNEFTTPVFLMRTALALEANGNKDEAAKFLQRLKDEYPKTPEAANADKYLARLGK